MENIKNMIEALIFSSGQPIEKKLIVEKIPELTTVKLNSIIKELKEKYDDNSGILLLEFNGKLQFSSNAKYGEPVTEILTPLRERALSKVLIEVLATIAYKQPITRAEIDDLRSGTSSEYAISTLLKHDLITPIGRRETIGRPVIYATTDNFLKKFQLSSLDDLPDYESVLEQLRLLNPQQSLNLFNKKLLDDEVEGTTEEVVEIVEETQEDELPDFLIGEDDIQVIE